MTGARPLRVVEALPPKLLTVAQVKAQIIGVRISDQWVRAHFAPAHRVRIGRGVYWPEPDAVRWWQGYLRDQQGAA